MNFPFHFSNPANTMSYHLSQHCQTKENECITGHKESYWNRNHVAFNELLFPCTVSETVFGTFAVQIESDFHMTMEWQLQHRTIAQNGIKGETTSCLCFSSITMTLCYCSCQRTVPIFKVITQYRLRKYATILNQILILGWVVLLEVTSYLNLDNNTLLCILIRLMYSKWIDQEAIETQSHPEYYSLGLTPHASLLI